MSFELVESSAITNIMNFLSELKQQVASMSDSIANANAGKLVYNNKEIKELLSIEDKTLRKYRDEGKLAYHREGDKYWYTQEDIKQFLANNYIEPYTYCS